MGHLPLETLSSHGSALKTIYSFIDKLSWPQGYRSVEDRVWVVFFIYLPQNPVSRPTEKQVVSVLNAAESETGPVESSITCLVFMVGRAIARGHDRGEVVLGEKKRYEGRKIER